MTLLCGVSASAAEGAAEGAGGSVAVAGGEAGVVAICGICGICRVCPIAHDVVWCGVSVPVRANGVAAVIGGITRKRCYVWRGIAGGCIPYTNLRPHTPQPIPCSKYST